MRPRNKTNVYILVLLLSLSILSTHAHAQSTGSTNANIVLSLLEQTAPGIYVGARRNQNSVLSSSLGDGTFLRSPSQSIKSFGLDAQDFVLSTFAETASLENGEGFASALVTGMVSFTNASSSTTSVVFELTGSVEAETTGGIPPASFLPSSTQQSFASSWLSVSSDDMVIDLSLSTQSEIIVGVGGGLFNSAIAKSYTLEIAPSQTTTLTFRNSSLSRSVVTSVVPEPSSGPLIYLLLSGIALRRRKILY